MMQTAPSTIQQRPFTNGLSRVRAARHGRWPVLAALVAWSWASLVTGCSQRSSAWHEVSVDWMSPAQKLQRQRAIAARDDMFQRLLISLHEEMAEEGPAGAIGVCGERAALIAKEVGGSHAVRIGRTSWRLRNPDNEAPSWADELVTQRPEEPRFMAGPDGTLGVMLPISTMSACVRCHGPVDQIDPELRDQLAARYPSDQATGFEEGDLRGWFWVEVDGG